MSSDKNKDCREISSISCTAPWHPEQTLSNTERSSSKMGLELTMEKIPYPKSVFFIIVCEFCERFGFYGMHAVLILYFKYVLEWSDHTSTVVYHCWIMLCNFSPLFGAMIAESLLGKFKTIFYLSIVYSTGSVLLALAATPPLRIPSISFSMIGLTLIAVGTGGIKPCVSAFGGDQFRIPGQESQLKTFFAFFYFSINCGSLLTTVITPILREDVSCFGDDTCYPLAFAVPASLMIIASTFFLLGRPLYRNVKPQGNIVLIILKAIKHSLSRRGGEIKAGRRREHWLDYANDKFEQRFLEECKAVFNVLFLYIPLPIFWTLFSQQGSRWLFQATRMNGHLWSGVGIKPDQMSVVNSILVLAFIPIFDRIIYPIFGKCNLLKKPLQRLTVGLFFPGAAFVVSAVLELFLSKTYAVELAAGESTLQIVNAMPNCNLNILSKYSEIKATELFPNERAIYESIKTNKYDVELSSSGPQCPRESQQTFILEPQKAITFVALVEGDKIVIEQSDTEEDTAKSLSGDPKLRVMYLNFDDLDQITFNLDGEKEVVQFSPNSYNKSTQVKEVEPDTYRMSVVHNHQPNGVTFNTSLEMKLGGSYLVTIVRYPTMNANGDEYSLGFHEITTPNTVHMFWLIPQLLVMSVGEIMVSITVMEFSYMEAPPNMKSVVQSAWLMTVAVGNLIVVLIAEAKIFQEQHKETFLYAGIMFVDVFIFMFMARRYKSSEKFWRSEKPSDEST